MDKSYTSQGEKTLSKGIKLKKKKKNREYLERIYVSQNVRFIKDIICAVSMKG